MTLCHLHLINHHDLIVNSYHTAEQMLKLKQLRDFYKNSSVYIYGHLELSVNEARTDHMTWHSKTKAFCTHNQNLLFSIMKYTLKKNPICDFFSKFKWHLFSTFFSKYLDIYKAITGSNLPCMHPGGEHIVTLPISKVLNFVEVI